MRRPAVLQGAKRSGAALLSVALVSRTAFSQAPAATPPPIRDIAPPLDLFPYPLWVVALAAVIAFAFVATISWLLFRWWRNRPPPAPPTPRSVAMRELHK